MRLEEAVCRSWYAGGGIEEGDWNIIKDEISMMEHVEYNNPIGHNIMNEDDIEDISSF